MNEPFLGASRPASPQRPAASARGSTSSRSTSSHSVEAPRLAESVEAETYGDGLTTVNYVDVQFERRGGDPEDSQDPTGTIQPFVEDICKVSSSKSYALLCSSSHMLMRGPGRRHPDLRRNRREVRVSAVQVGRTPRASCFLASPCPELIVDDASTDSVRNQRENVLMLVANTFRSAVTVCCVGMIAGQTHLT